MSVFVNKIKFLSIQNDCKAMGGREVDHGWSPHWGSGDEIGIISKEHSKDLYTCSGVSRDFLGVPFIPFRLS